MDLVCHNFWGRPLAKFEVGAGSRMRVAQILETDQELQVDNPAHKHHHYWKSLEALAESYGMSVAWVRKHDGLDCIWHVIEIRKSTSWERFKRSLRKAMVRPAAIPA
jgi:uncharacterized membrane protein